MAVTDLNDVELLHNATVKRKLLLFEFFEDKPTEVDG